MSTSSHDFIIRLPLAVSVAGDCTCQPSELECQVIGLFDGSRASLLRYVVTLGLSVSDGEEIVQEVFLALFRHLQLGRSRSNLRAWCFRVAHNLTLKQRSANHKLQYKHEPVEEALERHLDPTSNPEEQMMASQRQERLRAVLAVLPEQDRCCLYLRAEGLRYREIAGILGMSLGSISISLARSLARFGRADEGRSYAG
jgi:RNA polymerase sigma-70 factor (ECF subfamily)